MELKGTLAEGIPPGLLRELYVGRKTGLLHFTQGSERCSVCFRKGDVVFAQSNVDEMRFSDFLVRQGLVSEKDRVRAFERASREGKRLGLALEEMGLLGREVLENALAFHVREVLLRVFSWSDGEYAFEEQSPEAPEPPDITLRLPTGELILEAVRRVQDPDVVRYALGDIDRVLIPSTDPLLRFQKITLTPTDGYILSRVDGILSAREVIQLVPQPAQETQRSLFGLLCTGVIEYLPGPPKHAPRPAPPKAVLSPPPAAPPLPPPEDPAAAARRQEILDAYEGLKSRNHFEVLGIPKASTEIQVKEAYFGLAKQFHPDLHRDPVLADLRDKLEAVFIRLGEAYEVLRNPKIRSAYEGDLAARVPRIPEPAPPAPSSAAAQAEPPLDSTSTYESRMAEESVRKAEKYLEEGKYWDAIQLAEPAIPAAPRKFQQRARLVLARAYMKNPHWVRQAETMAHAIIEADAESIDAYLILGEIYKSGGLKSRAAAMFRKVLELKPDHEQALAESHALGAETPAEHGQGLMKKFFGKT